jgi:hypothetical protein
MNPAGSNSNSSAATPHACCRETRHPPGPNREGAIFSRSRDMCVRPGSQRHNLCATRTADRRWEQGYRFGSVLLWWGCRVGVRDAGPTSDPPPRVPLKQSHHYPSAGPRSQRPTDWLCCALPTVRLSGEGSPWCVKCCASGQGGSVHPTSLDADDYKAATGYVRSPSPQTALPLVSREVLESFPEGGPQFGYVVSDDGQLFVRTSH